MKEEANLRFFCLGIWKINFYDLSLIVPNPGFMSVFVTITLIFPGNWRIQQCIFCVWSIGIVKKKKSVSQLSFWERSQHWDQLKGWTWLQLWPMVLAFPFNSSAVMSCSKDHRNGGGWGGSIRELRRMPSGLTIGPQFFSFLSSLQNSHQCCHGPKHT